MDQKTIENSENLLQALEQHEQTLANLYQIYAERFEKHRDFWNNLVQEELKHAACIKTLKEQVASNPDVNIVQRFSVGAVQSSMNYINKLIEQSNDPEFQAVNAFSIAMNLEQAFLEKRFFEVLSGDSPEVKEILVLLEHETKQHLQMLQNAFKHFSDSNS